MLVGIFSFYCQVGERCNVPFYASRTTLLEYYYFYHLKCILQINFSKKKNLLEKAVKSQYNHYHSNLKTGEFGYAGILTYDNIPYFPLLENSFRNLLVPLIPDCPYKAQCASFTCYFQFG